MAVGTRNVVVVAAGLERGLDELCDTRVAVAVAARKLRVLVGGLQADGAFKIGKGAGGDGRCYRRGRRAAGGGGGGGGGLGVTLAGRVFRDVVVVGVVVVRLLND